MRYRTWLAAALLVAAGCSGERFGGQKADLQRSFFDRTIIYTLDPGAQEHMTKAERILMAARKTQEPLPDEELLPLYRDADLNRDHHITTKEAQAFAHEYTLRFEESLGRARVRPTAPAQPTQ
ncbi:MAG: hypothetical protein QHH07_05720 [Sedimentisphaerales bacterium]|jgi:hypothetical protein|nr:hypothetical protein [Sedimentisphaerales bacterium]